MKNSTSLLSVCVAMTLAAGCASTTMTTSPSDMGGTKLHKPNRILVYNFAASAADMPAEERAEFGGDPVTPTSPEALATGRELGEKVAERLVENINDMDMKAVVGDDAPAPQVGDIVIRGHFESIDEGSAVKRMAIGFGSGAADLKTVVTGYVMTEQGLRRVGGGTIDSGGGKGPGLFIPVIVTAATANPIGLIVGTAAKVEGQVSGRTTIDGAAKRTADAISERMKTRFEQEDWI